MPGIVDIYYFKAPSELLSGGPGFLTVPLEVSGESEGRFTHTTLTSHWLFCWAEKC